MRTIDDLNSHALSNLTMKKRPKHTTIKRNPGTLFRDWPNFRDEAEAFLAWLRVKGAKSRGHKPYSENSLYRYMCEFRKFCNIMAKLNKHPRELTYQDYLFFMSREKTSTKFPTTVKLYVRYLIDLAPEDSEDYVRYKRLYEKIQIPERKTAHPQVLTKEQVARLINTAGTVGGLEFKTLVALTYETGARISEILSLKKKDIVFDEYGAILHIKESKSKPRTLRVIMFARLLGLYLESMSLDDNDLIFTNNYNTYLRKMRKAWNLAGLPKKEDDKPQRMFHILRHTRATELYKRKILSEKEMMAWFGWRTREMIDVYSEITMKDVEESYLAAFGLVQKEEKREELIICPRCSSRNPFSAQYCNTCGFPLKEEDIQKIQKENIDLYTKIQELAKEIELLKKAISTKLQNVK